MVVTMKHTTGKWKVMPGDLAPRICVDGDPEWPIVMAVAGPTLEEAVANEHLIAAAPALLVALKRMLDSCHCASCKACRLARNAVSMAEQVL